MEALATMEGWYGDASAWGSSALESVREAQAQVWVRMAETLGPEWVTDLWAASTASLQAAMLWLKVLGPVARAGALYLWATPEALATVVMLLLLWLLHRHIRKQRYFSRLRDAVNARVSRVQTRYNAAIDSLRTRSRFAALFLPHIVYAGVVVLLCQLPFLRAFLASPSTQRIFSFLAPTVFSIIACTEATPSRDRMRFWIQYWCVYCFFSALTSLPFAETLLRTLPYSEEASSAISIWLVIPLLEGSSVTCSMIIPLISRSFFNIPTSFLQTRQNLVLDMLASIGIISRRTREILGQIFADIFLVALGLAFFFTPGFMTYYGCLLVGYIYPVFVSLRLLASVSAVPPEAILNRLIYWIVAVQFNTVHGIVSRILDILPLWYHVKLVGLLWLQLPYFDGAKRVFALFTNVVAPAVLARATPAVARAQTRLNQLFTTPRTSGAAASRLGGGSAIPSRLATAMEDATPLRHRPQAAHASGNTEAEEEEGQQQHQQHQQQQHVASPPTAEEREENEDEM
jgi:hypothetical protein